MNLNCLSHLAVLALTAVQFFNPSRSNAQAQGAQNAGDVFRKRTSVFSLQVGVGTVTGADYKDRDKINMEMFAGLQSSTSSRISYIGGLTLGKHQWNGGYDAVCLLASGGGCRPSAPEMRYALATYGVQIRDRKALFGASAGPGIFQLSDAVRSGSNSVVHGGVGARADLWFQVIRHLEVGGSASMRMVPSYRHNRTGANSISTGIRFVM